MKSIKGEYFLNIFVMKDQIIPNCMKKRILFILAVFVFHIVIFLLFKSAFTIIHSSLGGGVSITDFFAVLYNGLPLDMSVSGYLTALPALLTIASLWVIPAVVKKILSVYWILVSILLVCIFVVDLAIYPYWGFHFDSSIFLYLQKPKEALASASVGEMMIGFVAFIVLSVAVYLSIKKVLLNQIDKFSILEAKETVKPAIVLTLLTALLFLPIRGGVTVSTMNVGHAYFSDNMFLNHAAINPHFNLLYSLSKSEKFEEQYQFYEREKAEETFGKLAYLHDTDSITYLLKDKRPNIVLVILESFSALAAYNPEVAPNLVEIADEGINFTNFYANSFRTDRGLVSILSGYPAHPTVALMKYPKKTQSLPSIPKALVKEGYESSFYYGGDVNFASMRSYIVGACATGKVCGDKDFPMNTRMTKWGTPDEFVFERVFEDINAGTYKEPFITTLLTLSSHEPFDVPEQILEDPFLNAMHYTDQQIGIFMEKLKASRYWDNTLVIFLADHCMQSYPTDAKNYESERFHIPMVWSGGVVDSHREIEDYGSQNDLAATLLGQLDLESNDFKFSKNMLSQQGNKFAFYAYNNGFSMMDSTSVVIYDNDAGKVLRKGGDDLEEKAKSFFQMMYLDLGMR